MRFIISLLAVASLSMSASAAEDNLDAVLAGYLETIGGQAAIDQTNSVSASGTLIFPGGMEAPFTLEFMPKAQKMRMDFEFQGMQATSAYDGENGWAVMPFMGKTTAEPMADDQLKQARDQADFFGPLINHQAKGHTLELVGVTDIEGTEAYHIKVTKANEDVEDWYLDTEYYLPFRVESVASMMGQEVETTTTMGDYKEVEGLLVPFSVQVGFGPGEAQQGIVIDEMKMNPDIDASIFDMPEVAVEAASAD
jgi:outer membrane lipoprotein-sorting protein